MYSLQHVFWRGAMALSLFVLGGIGAGVSNAPAVSGPQACVRAEPPARAVRLLDGATVARIEAARRARARGA